MAQIERPGQRGGEGHLQRHFLVDRVLEDDAARRRHAGEGVGHLRGRRARVAAGERHARLERAAHDGLVAQQESDVLVGLGDVCE